MNSYRTLSLWHATVPERLEPGPALAGDISVDVAIVGGGFTGLWTAYYLRKAEPGLRIAVLEREIAGFGASGRNGGWCSALFPVSLSKLARMAGRAGAAAMYRAMQQTVDEVGRVVAAEGIDCHWCRGGTIQLARSQPQLERAKAYVAEQRAFGFGDQDIRLLGPSEATGMLAATHVTGGTYTPHCAAVHPARLVRGLADTVRRNGVRLYERTAALSIEPGRVRTATGTVRAQYVIRATEGYTPELPGLRRTVAPVYSLMIATEPLPGVVWDRIGLRQRATFGDYRHMIIYGQRTADGRFAFGGRGAPYHLGSRVRPEFDREPTVFAALRQTLAQMFPVLGDAEVTHTWGGPLGVTRDWCASAGFDRRSGLGFAGGYVGDGVATANLAGRTLTDLILGHDSDLARLPWVNHRSRPWETEPLRWLGANAALRLMARADRVEARTRRPARSAALVTRLIGG